jgi:CheY-like chemotaxis protein
MGKKSFRVLLVEDEPVIRELVTTMLEGDGIKVTCMSEGAGAVKSVKLRTPDLILLDVVLPGLDGFAVCRLLRADPQVPPVPIYMLTGRSRSADHQSARRVGANGFIAKPFKAEELQSLVAEVKSGRRPARFPR